MPGGSRINLENSLGKVIEEIYEDEKSKNSGLIKKLKMKKALKKKKK